MLPRSWNNHAPRIPLAATHNQTNNDVATGHRCCTCIIGPSSGSFGYTSVQPRSSDCVSRNDTVLGVLARIPKYRHDELAVRGWDSPVGKPQVVIPGRCLTALIFVVVDVLNSFVSTSSRFFGVVYVVSRFV